MHIAGVSPDTPDSPRTGGRGFRPRALALLFRWGELYGRLESFVRIDVLGLACAAILALAECPLASGDVMALSASRRLGFVVMPLAALALAVPGVAAAAEPAAAPAPITLEQCEQGWGYVSSDRAGDLRCVFGEYHGQLVSMPQRAVRRLA
ncbi:hypothetical protein ACFQLX_22825 [Streptomyces polyrhachis]|uniref:Uncharacterized protein n=1 Tax=Streptomyces polyrhachis TaxID=1282885 RepID=A0ABW2GMS4_9ACTN